MIDRAVTPQKSVPRDFMQFGNCMGVETQLMFPERGVNPADAKALCRSCDVQVDCLEYALTPPVEKFGIWGGTSEQERRRLRRRRNRMVASVSVSVA